MATKKKLLQAAAGSAGGGAAALNVEDVFSTYLYDGNGESQSIDNGINLGQSNDGGSAHFEPDDSNDTDEISLASANYITSGDFTIECFVWIEGLNSTNSYGYEIPTIFYFNSPRLSLTYDFLSPGGSADQAFNLFDTDYRFGSTNQHPEATYTNTWVHVAVVRNSGTIRCYVDGTEAFNFSNTTDYSGATLTIGNNSNGTPLQGHISNFRVVDGTAIYTSSFTPPTSELTAISGTTLLTFTSENTLTDTSSSSHAFTVTGSVSASNFGPFDAASAGEGGLVWIKERAPSTDFHILQDSERGAGKSLFTNNTNAEGGNSGDLLSSFNSNGFTVNNDYLGGTNTSTNGSGQETVSWTFRKAPKFFDVVTWTGDGTAGRTISHNLNSSVGTIFVKRTDGLDEWATLHRNDGSQWKTGVLNSTTSFDNAGVNLFGNGSSFVAPTSTEFTVTGNLNGNTDTFVAYLFAHNDGDGTFGPTGDQDVIRCGSYTGNGSTDGPEINLGFEPQWVLWKNANRSDASWSILDNMRGINTGSNDPVLNPNTSGSEWPNGNYMSLTATGFKITTTETNTNASGDSHIYIAIRRGPMAVPTDATDVYKTIAYSGTNVARHLDTGFVTDLEIIQSRNSAETWEPSFKTRLTSTGNLTLNSSSTSAEYNWGTNGNTDLNTYQHGTSRSSSYWNSSGYNYVSHQFSRAPNCFDVVAYTGNGTAGRTVSHNLGVAPEMIWVKARTGSGREWTVWHKDTGGNGWLRLNTTDSLITGIEFRFGNNSTYVAPTDTEFTVGSLATVNASSDPYIAYLFASLDGVSKVGSYTGNGTSQTIDCGFSSGARFVLIKRTDDTADWIVYDTARGIVTGNEPHLYLNRTDAEVTNDLIDPDPSGFIIDSYFADWNASGGNYIFYAIA